MFCSSSQFFNWFPVVRLIYIIINCFKMLSLFFFFNVNLFFFSTEHVLFIELWSNKHTVIYIYGMKRWMFLFRLALCERKCAEEVIINFKVVIWHGSAYSTCKWHLNTSRFWHISVSVLLYFLIHSDVDIL